MFHCKNVAKWAHAQLSTHPGTFFRVELKIQNKWNSIPHLTQIEICGKGPLFTSLPVFSLFLVTCYSAMSLCWLVDLSVPLRTVASKGPMTYAFTHERFSPPSPSSPSPPPQGFDPTLETPNPALRPQFYPQGPKPSLETLTTTPRLQGSNLSSAKFKL